MSETSTLGFPEAARRFGVSISVLRRAIRTRRLDETIVAIAAGLGAFAEIVQQDLAAALCGLAIADERVEPAMGAAFVLG